MTLKTSRSMSASSSFSPRVRALLRPRVSTVAVTGVASAVNPFGFLPRFLPV